MGQSQYRNDKAVKDNVNEWDNKEAPEEKQRASANFKAATPMANSPKAAGDGKRENPGRPV